MWLAPAKRSVIRLNSLHGGLSRVNTGRSAAPARSGLFAAVRRRSHAQPPTHLS